MYIRVNVTEAEKVEIQRLAEDAGQSMSTYILARVLYDDDPKSNLLLFSEIEASVAQSLNDLVNTTIRNKVIFEEQLLEMLSRMDELEQITVAALREVSRNGYTGQ